MGRSVLFFFASILSRVTLWCFLLAVVGTGASPALAAGAGGEGGVLAVVSALEVRKVVALLLTSCAAGIWAENNTRLGSVGVYAVRI